MYENWPTIKETIQRTRMSERSLYRRIQDGSLRQTHRKVPGRKPILVLHPDDVAKLEAETVKPVSMPPELIEVPATTQPATKPATAGWVAELANLAKGILQEQPRVRLSEKFMLTLNEASELSGLPHAYLLRKVRSGEIPAIKVPGWRIKRADLEKAYGGLTNLE
jgi:excisionase family DNA binding protein